VSSSCLLLFTKPARPGQVKTRLIGDLSAEQTAALHAAFLGDLVARLRGRRFELRLAWALADGEREPPLGEPSLAALPLSGLRHLRQEGATLGDRLFGALSQAAREHARVAAVGSDHPTLSAARVEEAFSALAAAPVVIGPASDGGYYLLAARAEALSPRLFADVPWSGADVLTTTLARCAELGIEPYLLPQERDVDTPADLPPLVAALAGGEVAAPRTRALLECWGLLSEPLAALATTGGGAR
jgi:hypothetical protein